MSELPEHVVKNRAKWDDLALQFVEAGERAWAREEPAWGIWKVPEAEVSASREIKRQGCYRAGMWHRLHFPRGSHAVEPAL